MVLFRRNGKIFKILSPLLSAICFSSSPSFAASRNSASTSASTKASAKNSSKTKATSPSSLGVLAGSLSDFFLSFLKTPYWMVKYWIYRPLKERSIRKVMDNVLSDDSYSGDDDVFYVSQFKKAFKSSNYLYEKYVRLDISNNEISKFLKFVVSYICGDPGSEDSDREVKFFCNRMNNRILYKFYSFVYESNKAWKNSKVLDEEFRKNIKKLLRKVADLLDERILISIKLKEKGIKFGKKVGQGGFGTTYMAKKDGKDVIVKIQKPSSSDLDSRKDLVMNGGKVEMDSIDFSSDKVMKYIKRYNMEDYCVDILEFVNGKTLEDVVTKKTSLIKILEYIQSMFESVSRLHERNLVHRDIKPENSIVKSDGSVHLIDCDMVTSSDNCFRYMGTQIFASPECKNSVKVNGHMLRDFLNSIYGTDEFNCTQLDPILDVHYDGKKSDIYSVGASLAYLMFGDNALKRWNKNQTEFGSKMQNGSDVPDEVLDFLYECLDSNPENRPDADQAVEELGKIIKSLKKEKSKNKSNFVSLEKEKSKNKNDFVSLKKEKSKNKDEFMR